MSDKKKYLILERFEVNLKRSEGVADSPYVFEGECADFKMNENSRIYDRDDYLSHLPYLKEQIEANSLLGEMDHPDTTRPNGYMVYMKEVSHKVIDLYWDEASNTVKIAIELIPTTRGKDAMAIADAGVPIYISSRASGYISDTGEVTIDKIYTYDIVYRPGFKNAKLDRARLDESAVLNRKVNSDSVAIYEWQWDEEVAGKGTKFTKQQNNKIDMKDKSTGRVFETKVAGYLNEVRKVVNEHTAQIKEIKDLIMRHAGHKDLIVEAVNRLGVAQSRYEGKLKMLAEYSNLQTGRVNRLAEYSNLQTGQINRLVDYSDMQTKRINEHTRYADYVTNNLNKLILEHNGVKDNGAKLISYANLISTTVNGILESKQEKPAAAKPADVRAKVRAIKERRMEAGRTSLISSYPFLAGVSATTHKMFEGMDDGDRAAVREHLASSGQKVTVALVEGAIQKVARSKSQPGIVGWLPNDLKPVWESISEQKRNSIIALSHRRNIPNRYSADIFWRSVLGHGSNVQRVVESLDTDGHNGSYNELGYSEGYVKSVLGL